jgi:ribokinase
MLLCLAVSETDIIIGEILGKILVLGSINIDIVSFVKNYPCPGETIVGNDFGVFQEGKGAN